MDILAGVRVVDRSTGIAGPYATKLLADAGAEVVRVGADPAAPLDRFLGEGKAVARTDEALLAGAAALVLGPSATAEEVAGLRCAHPHLVVVTVTPWGLRGPWVGRPATEFTVQAEAGVIANHGRADEVPYQTGGRVPEWCAGVTAAVGTLGALVGGRGRHVDVSLQAVAAHTGIALVDVRDRVEGSSVGSRSPRIIDTPGIEPTADGFVGFAAHSPAQMRAFLTLIERTDLLGSDWENLAHRLAHLDEWNAIVHAWTARHSTDAVVAAASALRIPVAPVVGPEAVLTNEQVVARRLVVDGRPVGPYLIDGERPGGNGVLEPEHPRTGPFESALVPERPLQGVRVLDCTSVFAGPSAAQVLCYLGAEVIHVESCERIDSGRAIVGALMGTDTWWERAGMFLSNNRDKLGIAVSLGAEEGRDVLRRLIERSDVVLENFAPRVFERFGFDHDAVREINARAVYARMPAFGLDGPWRDHVGFAQTMEQVSGMAWRTGYPDGPPRVPRGPCDPLTGYHAVFAVLLGLIRRERTGAGAAVEVPMIDCALNAAAELILEYTANGTVLQRLGNRSATADPQGVYPCRGHEEWLAVSVTDDAQRQALCALLRASDDLDPRLARWAVERDVADAVEELVAAGIPAGTVQDPRLLSDHVHLRAWGYYEESDHPVVGRAQIPALPFRYDDVDRWSRSRAPLLGEHNEQVLCGLLGMDTADLEKLLETGVIGSRPVEA